MWYCFRRHFDKRTLEGQVVCEESIQPSFLSGLATVHCILLHIQSGGASLHLGVHLKVIIAFLTTSVHFTHVLNICLLMYYLLT